MYNLQENGSSSDSSSTHQGMQDRICRFVLFCWRGMSTLSLLGFISQLFILENEILFCIMLWTLAYYCFSPPGKLQRSRWRWIPRFHLWPDGKGKIVCAFLVNQDINLWDNVSLYSHALWILFLRQQSVLCATMHFKLTWLRSMQPHADCGNINDFSAFFHVYLHLTNDM